MKYTSPVPSEPRVGVVTSDKVATESLLKSARGSFKFVPLDASTAAIPALDFDAFILVFGEPPETSVRFFAECIEAAPHIPILGVSSLDSTHVVELLKCGMADHLAPPIDSDLLKRKLMRMIQNDAGTVLDSDLLESLPRAAVPAKPSQRKCARALVPVGFPANIKVLEPAAQLKVIDISVPTLEAPGGLCAEADAETTKRLPPVRWDIKSMLAIQIQVPAHVSPQTVPARARVVRTTRGPDQTTRIGMQFWLDRMRDEGLLQRFWIKCHIAQRARGAAKK
jgi:hypothetical protein